MSRPKKFVKSNINQFHEKKFLDQISFFAISKMAKKSIFELGKSLKQARNAISRKKFLDLFDFTSFFAQTFLNFLARCAIHCCFLNKYCFAALVLFCHRHHFCGIPLLFPLLKEYSRKQRVKDTNSSKCSLIQDEKKKKL